MKKSIELNITGWKAWFVALCTVVGFTNIVVSSVTGIIYSIAYVNALIKMI